MLALFLSIFDKLMIMGFFKTFLLGVATAYGIQYITKKRYDGTSILSDLIDDPIRAINRTKYYAKQEIDDIADEAQDRIS